MADYMLFLYDSPSDFSHLSPDEMQAIIAKYSAWADDLQKRGKLAGSDKLADGEGRVLRWQDGAVRVTDGPFSETKEILGGYFKIQADSYDEAVSIAETCPHLESTASSKCGAPICIDPSRGGRPRSRLGTVLESIYLIFDRGYSAYEGDRLVLEDVCHDALRLAELLTGHQLTRRPETHALASLLSFQTSRLRARVDGEGDPVLLADQDRSLWDTALVGRGFVHLAHATGGERETTYHLQAAIAAQHAGPDGADWRVVRQLYDRLYELHTTPVVALNRAVAVAHDEDADAGLSLLGELEQSGEAAKLQRYHLLPSARAELLLRTGDVTAAAEAYRQALCCPCSEPERRFLSKRLAAVTVPS